MKLGSLRKSKPVDQGRHSRIEAEKRPQSYSYHAVRLPKERQTRVPVGGEPISSVKRPIVDSKRLVTVLLWSCLGVLFWYHMYLGTTPVIVPSTDASAMDDAARAVYQADATKLFSGSIFNRNKLTLDTRGTARKLIQKHPEIQQAVVSAPVFGAAPRVTLTLMKPVARLQTAGQTYGLDPTGHTLSVAPADGSAPLVIDEANVIPIPGRRFLPIYTVKAITTISEQSSAAGLEVASITLPKSNPYELVVRLQKKPFYIRYNLQADVLQQSGAMIATIKHLGSGAPREYLDVRVPGKIYYK
ncbi:MAG: hypothetical protein WBO35_06480 [Candidatus Saccharimonadales bacterium]